MRSGKKKTEIYMKKASVTIALIMFFAFALAGCGNKETSGSDASSARSGGWEPVPQAQDAADEAANEMPAGSETEAEAEAEAPTESREETPAAGETAAETAEAPAAAEPARQDGERFDAVIYLEGMEEPVHYEHVINASLGFEMDYDYETFVRYTEDDKERFVMIWDDQDNPEHYLEIWAETEDAEKVAERAAAELSKEYEIYRETRELEKAGSVNYIGADVVKNTNNTAEQMQFWYIVPASDGCRVAAVHLYGVDSDGTSKRFRYMLDTLSVTGRN